MCVQVVSKNEKSNICDFILRALPNWFGVESSIVEYVEAVKSMVFFSVFNDALIGFIALKKHNSFTHEIYVMGVLPEYHRKGIGKTLIEHCERYCMLQNVEFLTVKTLDESRQSEDYEKTRLFYISMKFKPLEVFLLF